MPAEAYQLLEDSLLELLHHTQIPNFNCTVVGPTSQ